MAQETTITLENGETVLVYTSSLRGTKVNSNDCDTEYTETTKGSGVYKKVEK